MAAHVRRIARLAGNLVQQEPCASGLDPLVVSPWAESQMAPRDAATPEWHTFGPASRIAASEPVRLGDVVGGHVHPALCCTQSGAVLAVYNEVRRGTPHLWPHPHPGGDPPPPHPFSSALAPVFWPQEGGGAQVLKICRSEDGGKSWTAPAPIPSSASRSARGVYPGSLSVLASGRIVLQFAPYYELGEHQHGDPAQLTVSAGIGAGEVYRVPEYCCSDDGTRSSHTTYSHNLSLKRMPRCFRRRAQLRRGAADPTP